MIDFSIEVLNNLNNLKWLEDNNSTMFENFVTNFWKILRLECKIFSVEVHEIQLKTSVTRISRQVVWTMSKYEQKFLEISILNVFRFYKKRRHSWLMEIQLSKKQLAQLSFWLVHVYQVTVAIEKILIEYHFDSGDSNCLSLRSKLTYYAVSVETLLTEFVLDSEVAL